MTHGTMSWGELVPRVDWFAVFGFAFVCLVLFGAWGHLSGIGLFFFDLLEFEGRQKTEAESIRFVYICKVLAGMVPIHVH